MFNFSKTKKIIFTAEIEPAKTYPPVLAKSNLPSWYKKTKTYIRDDNAQNRMMNKNSNTYTIKKCIPVQDYLVSGYTFRAITDIQIYHLEQAEIDSHYCVLPTDWFRGHIIGDHPHNQCPTEIDGKKFHYVKIFSGWGIKTPPGYSCMIYQNFYDFNFPIKFMPAIIDTDTFNESIGLIGYITTNNPNFEIKAGTPLVNIYPFKRDDWEMERKFELNPEKFAVFKRYASQHFKNIYRNLFHSKKQFD